MARFSTLAAAALIAAPLVQGLSLHSSQAPPGPTSIFVEVVGAPPQGGPSIQSVESNFMNTLAPGAQAFKMMDDDFVAHDELYRTRTLNYLTIELSKMGMSCANSRYCVQDWIRQANRGQGGMSLEPMVQLQAESAQKGCLTLGGCKKALEDSFTQHVKENHNVIFESSGVDYPEIQKRINMIHTIGQYRTNLLGLVCTPWTEMENAQTLTAAAGIVNFLQRPKDMPAPSAVRLQPNPMAQRLLLCTMSDILSCMSGTGDKVRTADGKGKPHPCNPTPDGLYVWMHSAAAQPSLVGFPQHGGSESDENFKSARNAIAASMPPGMPDCSHRV